MDEDPEGKKTGQLDLEDLDCHGKVFFCIKLEEKNN